MAADARWLIDAQSIPSPTRRRPYGALLLTVLCLGYAGTVLMSADHRQPGIDSHYHFKMATEIGSGDLTPDMAEDLPWTVYKDLNVDHYWGYHVLLSPFTAFEDREIGMKVASIVLFVLILLALYFFLRELEVPYAWIWAALPLLITSLDWRYMMLRGAQVMVPLVLLHLWFAFQSKTRRSRWIGLVFVAYIGMLSYQGAVIMLAAHVAALGGILLFRGFGAVRSRAVDPLFTTGGLLLGLLINPYMDSSASTFRFASYHIFSMGTDALSLYPRRAEFHGFPLEAFVEQPEWTLLAVLVLSGLAWVVVRRLRGKEISETLALTAGLAMLALVLAARALRTIEYGVPFMIIFLGVFAARWRPPQRLLVHALSGVLIVIGLAYHGKSTVEILRHPQTLDTRMYEGAREVLERHHPHPVLNIAESDYNLLLWEDPGVSCVHGLSRYFLHPNREVWEDLRILKRRGRATEKDIRRQLEAVGRFYRRGVRLVASHVQLISGHATPFYRLAKHFPHIFESEFRSHINSKARDALIVRIDARALRRCLASPKLTACMPPS